MRKISITDKLIIASLLISVITIIIVASYSFFNAKKAILDRTFNQLNSVRVIKTNLIEKFFLNCSKEVNLAKSSSDIYELLKQINKIETSDDYILPEKISFKKNKKFFNLLLQEHYNQIFIIGRNKNIFPLKRANETFDIFFKNCNILNDNVLNDSSVFIKDYSVNKITGKPYITLSSKITDENGTFLGVIIFEILSNAIDKLMLNENPSSGLGVSGESYLVGKDYLMRSSSRFQKESILKTVVKTEGVDSAFQNIFGTKVIQDYRDITVLSSYGKINVPNLNWVILAEIDYKEVTIPIYKIRNEIIFISIFIFLIVLLVVIVLSKRITYPIQKLNQAAHEVGGGNLDVEIKTKTDDEIGELTETFNLMVKKLKAQSKELEIEKTKSLRSLIDGQEYERQRLSRELHDSLGQLLIALKLKFESSFVKKNKPDKAQLNLGNLFDKTIEETRRISNNLMPAALSEFGLTTAIRNICNDISETTNIDVQLITKGSGKELNSEIKTYLFRIIQEAMTNIVKHSKANKATIRLEFTTEKVIVNINDNGIGFNQVIDKKKKSNGLNNISDRVLLLKGIFKINSQPQKGTHINILIPVKK